MLRCNPGSGVSKFVCWPVRETICNINTETLQERDMQQNMLVSPTQGNINARGRTDVINCCQNPKMIHGGMRMAPLTTSRPSTSPYNRSWVTDFAYVALISVALTVLCARLAKSLSRSLSSHDSQLRRNEMELLDNLGAGM